MQIEIGILDCVTGKVIRKKITEQEVALDEAKKMSKWFDKQDTFFSKAVWEHWSELGILSKFEKLADGNSYNDVAFETVAVFPKSGARGVEHEFYMKRRK